MRQTRRTAAADPLPRFVAAAALAVVAAGLSAAAPPQVPPLAAGMVDCGGSSGVARTAAVRVPEHGTGVGLPARMWAPDAARQRGPCPVISVLPGGGAGISSVEWAAVRLAVNGYVVIVTQPSRGASADAYHRAAMGSIDFLESDANPYRRDSAVDRVGVAGWSLGARALTRTQAEDARIDALVAWDNLAISETGDAGSPACTNRPRIVRAPRVPALGIASEACPARPRDSKLTAFEHWRGAGVPVMQIVFAGANHFWWSARAGATRHELTHAYTQAWFDRWLKDDVAATDRLIGRTVPGASDRRTAGVLSVRFRSAAAVDGRFCADLQAGC